jgi:hypothetical protein
MLRDLTPEPALLGAREIEEALDPFTQASDTILTLANRYDGLDLPDDDCRLLILAGSPRATNDLEGNLSTTWKLGPALRWREATRLVQGMGRCTRNATDFAVICLLGQSLVNVSTNQTFLRLLPPTLQAEIEWGRAQLADLKHDPDSFAEMVVGLIDDPKYRAEADQAISELVKRAGSLQAGDSIATREIVYARAIWDGDFSGAHEAARNVADNLSGEQWAGYRCWWLYLSSVSARLAGNKAAELDAIRRAKATGINAGWLDHVSRMREGATAKIPNQDEAVSNVVAERIWTALDELGWSGKRFLEYCDEMLDNLRTVKHHTTFHRGLAQLGRLLGAQCTTASQQGDPDVIWRFADQVWVCIEAKAAKVEGGQGLSKRDLLEARGHVDWVKFFEAQGKRNVRIIAALVSSTDKVQAVARPHRDTLYLLKTDQVAQWGKSAQVAMLELRAKYVGQEFAAARKSFAQDLSKLNVDFGSTISVIKETPL